MDDRLKCNIIPKLWGFGALWDQCHLIPKAIRTVRLLQSGLLHSAALLWRGEREASNSNFAMECLISRTLKCEYQIKRLGLRSTVALSQGRGKCTRFKEPGCRVPAAFSGCLLVPPSKAWQGEALLPAGNTGLSHSPARVCYRSPLMASSALQDRKSVV